MVGDYTNTKKTTFLFNFWLLTIVFYLIDIFSLFSCWCVSNPCCLKTWQNSKKSSLYWYAGCPNKHRNSVTFTRSSLLKISIVIPDFKSHNIIMSARVYFMKTVNGCKDMSIMSPQDEQWRRTSLLCLYTVIFLFY